MCSIEKINRFRQLLSRGTVCLGDGAVGTRLQELAGRTMPCPETLVLEATGRRLLATVHREYIAAGAQWIETHTFGANAWRLQTDALSAQCAEINRLAAEIALTTAADDAVVLGAVGPLDRRESGTASPPHELTGFYEPQIKALADAGVDGFLLETFARHNDAEAALQCATATGLPIVFAIGGQRVARAFARRSVIDLIRLADRYNAAAIGLNCLPPYDISRLLPLLTTTTSRPLLAMPNAGTPQVLRGCVTYDLPTDHLLREANHWVSQGVAILGGCCGTRPDHINALSQHMAGQRLTPRPAIVNDRDTPLGSSTRTVAATLPHPPLDTNQPLRRIIRQSTRPLIAVEVRPALQRSFAQTIERLTPLIDCRPDLFDIPDNPGANPGRSSLICAYLLQQARHLPVVAHYNPSQSNALRLTADLLSAADLGISGILAVSGDSPHLGPFDRHATRVNDIRNAVELLQLLGLLRQGELLNGQPIRAPIDICAGCALAPSLSLKRQVAWLDKKIDAGAEYVFTQPVFDTVTVDRLHDVLPKHNRVPVFLGIFPVVSARQATFLQAGKIPGIVLPEAIATAVARFDQPDDQAAAGMEQTMTLIEKLYTGADGFYVIMPFHARSETLTATLVRHIRQSRAHRPNAPGPGLA